MNYTYYRSLLTQTQQKAYDLLVEAMIEVKTNVTLPHISSSEISKILDYIDNDYPELCYFSWDKDRFCYYDRGTHLDVTLKYDVTREAALRIRKKTAEFADKLIEYARRSGCRTKLEIAAYIHDYITDNISYTEKKRSPKRNHCYLGALANGETVCEGYSKLYLHILDRAKIKSILVVGKTEGSEVGHVWNLVETEEGWFHVDSTWDSNGKGKKGDWDYFLLSDSEIKNKKHILPTDVKLPPCNKTIKLNRKERRIR